MPPLTLSVLFSPSTVTEPPAPRRAAEPTAMAITPTPAHHHCSLLPPWAELHWLHQWGDCHREDTGSPETPPPTHHLQTSALPPPASPSSSAIIQLFCSQILLTLSDEVASLITNVTSPPHMTILNLMPGSKNVISPSYYTH